MGLTEDREEFRAELEERLETARLKDPQVTWEATIRPWWELAADVLTRQGYDCQIIDEEARIRRFRVWNETIGWPGESSAEMIYTWDTSHVEVTQRIAHPKHPVHHRDELPLSRLTAEKVREHLRRFVKDIKTYVATLSEARAE